MFTGWEDTLPRGCGLGSQLTQGVPFTSFRECSESPTFKKSNAPAETRASRLRGEREKTYVARTEW